MMTLAERRAWWKREAKVGDKVRWMGDFYIVTAIFSSEGIVNLKDIYGKMVSVSTEFVEPCLDT